MNTNTSENLTPLFRSAKHAGVDQAQPSAQSWPRISTGTTGAPGQVSALQLPDEWQLIEIERRAARLFLHDDERSVPCGCCQCTIAVDLQNYCGLVRKIRGSA
jgi:hypothetical protein